MENLNGNRFGRSLCTVGRVGSVVPIVVVVYATHSISVWPFSFDHQPHETRAVHKRKEKKNRSSEAEHHMTNAIYVLEASALAPVYRVFLEFGLLEPCGMHIWPTKAKTRSQNIQFQ